MLIFMGCGGSCGSGGSTGGCGGCGGTGCMAAIPGGFPAAQRQSEAVSVKLTESGLNSITGEIPTLVEQLTGTTGTGSFAIPCVGPATITSVANGLVSVNAYVCDTGGNQCRTSTPPPFGQCTAALAIDGVTIGTQENNADGSVTVNVTINAQIDTTQLPVNVSAASTLAPNTALCAIQCIAQFHSSTNAPAYVPIAMKAKLRVDHNYNNILTMSVDFPDFSQSIDTSELTITSTGQTCAGGFFNFGCDILNANFIKQILFSQIQAQLTPTLQDLVDGFRCLPCQTDADCPRTPQVSTCGSTNVCYVDQGNHICVPNPLGLEGRTNVGSLLGTFGAPPDAALDVSIIAGGLQAPVGTQPAKPSLNATPANSIQIGVMGGTRAPAPASCVPPAVWTDLPTPPEMNFDTEAHADGFNDYGIGISVSDPFMNKGLFDAWQSGMLCLNIAQENVSLLSSTLFSALLTNLDALTHKENVPMAVALRPTQPPNIRVGKGTTKVMNGMTVIDDPIITMNLPKVHVDFYAFLEERYTRLFTIETDLSVPIGLDFVPSSTGTGTSVNLLLGTITAPLEKTSCLNNLMNVESDEECKNFLPGVIGLVSGQLTNALPSFDIPAFQGIQLDVMGAKGSIPTTDHSGFDHLALFAKLSIAPAGPEVAGVRTTADIVDSFIPAQPKPMDATTQPRVTIQATATGARSLQFHGYEYNYRVDGGAWTFWTPDAKFVVDSPVLRLPGNHDIEVRARMIGLPTSIDTEGAHVSVSVDYSAPTVALKVDPVSGKLMTSAFDDSTPVDQIAFRYSFNGGEWSAPGPTQLVDLSELGNSPWVRVEATDLSGHAAIASYGSASVVKSTWKGPDHKAGTVTHASAAGCSEVGMSIWALGGLVGLLARRRRARR
jgi:hypothetical protein